MTTETRRKLEAAKRERRRLLSRPQSNSVRRTITVLDRVIQLLQQRVDAQTLWKAKRTPRMVRKPHPVFFAKEA